MPPDPLTRKIDSLVELTAAERAALARAVGPSRDYPKDSDIVTEGQATTACIIML